jgi:hypothetical protein
MKESQEKFTPPTHWIEDEDEDEPETPPELAQSGCLSPSRLNQHGEKAQIICDKEPILEPDTSLIDTRGKSASCTVEKDPRSELEVLRSSTPNTIQAIITFERHSVQMFFSPENALTDFRRKVKEVWNIPSKIYHLLINGAHESRIPKTSGQDSRDTFRFRTKMRATSKDGSQGKHTGCFRTGD